MFNLKRFSDNIAAISDDLSIIKYSDLENTRRLVEQNIPKRSLVFCLCRNTIGSLSGYVSFLECGIVPLMLDASKSTDIIKNLASIYKPNYIWLPKEKIPDFEGQVIISLYDYSLIEVSSDAIKMHDSLAMLLTTSGSTGSPKLVRLSQKNIISNAESIASYLEIKAQDRPITSLPMYYSFGLSVINSHLISGATLLLTDKSVMQKEFWNLAKEMKATTLSGVPYTFEMLKRLRFFKMDLPCLNTLTQAGGKLNADLAKEYIENSQKAGKKFFVMYGQTEATARMSYLEWEYASYKYSSIGKAIPGGKLSVIDSNNNEIKEPYIDGELIYTGDNVSLGYAECQEDLCKGDYNQGILHTGDIAHFDSDGFFYITGRMKRFLKVFGNRINLDALEQILKSKQINCAIGGIDDKITVFATSGDAQSIKDILVKKTGLNIRAFDVRHIESLPQNNAGKIQYSELQKLL